MADREPAQRLISWYTHGTLSVGDVYLERQAHNTILV
jgi:hypothetical protein